MKLELAIKAQTKRKLSGIELSRIIVKLHDFCYEFEENSFYIDLGVVIDNKNLTSEELQQIYDNGVKELLSEIREISN